MDSSRAYNTGRQARLIAGATQERTLAAVTYMLLLGLPGLYTI